MGRIIVFTTPGCRHCVAVRALLAEVGAPFEEVGLSGAGRERVEELRALAGVASVPQVFLNDDLVRGGLTTLRQWRAAGELAGRVAAALAAAAPEEPRVLTAAEWWAAREAGAEAGGLPVARASDSPPPPPPPLSPDEYWRGVRLLEAFTWEAAGIAAAGGGGAAADRDSGEPSWKLQGVTATAGAEVGMAHECDAPQIVTFRGADLVSFVARRLALPRPAAMGVCAGLHATGAVTALDYAARRFDDSSALYCATVCSSPPAAPPSALAPATDPLSPAVSSSRGGGGGGGGGGGVAAFEIEAAAPPPLRFASTVTRMSDTAAMLAAFLAPASDGARWERFSSDGDGTSGSSGSSGSRASGSEAGGGGGGQATAPPPTSPPAAPTAPVTVSAAGVLLLNMTQLFQVPPGAAPRSAAAVGSDLRRSLLALTGRFLSADGTFVDYDAMRGSQEMDAYVAATAELQVVDAFTLSVPERKAFFINLYNALVIHATVAVGAPGTAWARSRFFTTIGYRIGPYAFTLDDMEHGILRANRRHPYQLAARLGRNDPRRALALPYLDPRIHFALVCGARSCPAIQLYSATNVERALRLATEAFFADATNFTVLLDGAPLTPTTPLAAAQRAKVATVTASKILHWYGSDFGASSHTVMLWCVPYLPTPTGDAVAAMLGAPRSTGSSAGADSTMLTPPPSSVAAAAAAAADAATDAAPGASLPPTPTDSPTLSTAAKGKLISELSALFPSATTLRGATAGVPDTSFRGIGGRLPRVVLNYAEYDWTPNGRVTAAAPAAVSRPAT